MIHCLAHCGVFRYFKCAPLHGLFAPLHKVTSLSASGITPRRPSLLQNTGLMSSHRTNSQESLSSIGSTSSMSRSGRMRLGVMSLSGHVSINVAFVGLCVLLHHVLYCYTFIHRSGKDGDSYCYVLVE